MPTADKQATVQARKCLTKVPIFEQKITGLAIGFFAISAQKL
jgi:hypothetical protein